MAASQAKTNIGATFSHMTAAGPPAVYTDIGEAVSITPPNPTRETVDVTHLTSPNATREFLATIKDGGEAEVLFNDTPAARTKCETLFGLDEVSSFRILWPSGKKRDFNAVVIGLPSEPIEIDSVQRFSLAMKVSGLPVSTPAP